MLKFLVTTAALAVVFLPAPTNAFWILSHSQPVVVERLDPIVSSCKVSGHVHAIAGSDGFGPSMDFTQMRAGSCTTSPVQADKSNYWAPQLYHQDSDGSFSMIPISFINTYYLQRTGPNTPNVETIPAGLRMIAGNPYRTSYNDSNMEDKAISYVCLDYSKDPTPQTNTFPTNNCPDGVRAQVVFPSCWNGNDLDSTNHKSHMSYPIGAPDTGDCPADFPHKIVTLFNEWVFDVGHFPFTEGANNWVFSTGDQTGLGFHADFANGWDQAVLDAAVAQCTGNIFGNLEECPPFAETLNRDAAKQCSLAPVVQEDVAGPLPKLPGCNAVPSGSGPGVCPDLAVPDLAGGMPALCAATASTATSASMSTTTSTTSSTDPTSTATSATVSATTTSSAPSSTESGATDPNGGYGGQGGGDEDCCDPELECCEGDEDCDDDDQDGEGNHGTSTSTTTVTSNGPSSTSADDGCIDGWHHHHHHHHHPHRPHLTPTPTPTISRRMAHHRRGVLNRLSFD